MGMQMHRCHHNHRPMSSSRCGRPNRLPTSQKVILTVRHSLPIYPNEQTFSESGESSASSRLLALKKALPDHTGSQLGEAGERGFDLRFGGRVQDMELQSKMDRNSRSRACNCI
jgi:hypothetical protein